MLINDSTKSGSVVVEIAVAVMMIVAVGAGVYAVQHPVGPGQTASAVVAQQ